MQHRPQHDEAEDPDPDVTVFVNKALNLADDVLAPETAMETTTD